MPAQRNQRSTRPATTRAGSTTARRGNGGNGTGRRNNRAAYWPVELSIGTTIDLVVEGQNGDTGSETSQDRPLMLWEDNIDLGEGIIPIHLLNLVCAVHLRQEHGFKRWQISRFKQTYPWLIREDATFAFAALHYLVHVLVQVEEAAVPLDESGTVAFVRLIKPPEVTDHQHP